MIIAAMLLSQFKAEITEAEVVAVVAADNPLDSLTRIELVNIFLGKSRHFPDGRLARPVDLQEGAEARQVFYAEFAGKSPAQVRAHWSKMIFTGRGQPPRRVKSVEEVRQWVAATPNAIGYLDAELVGNSIKVVDVR